MVASCQEEMSYCDEPKLSHEVLPPSQVLPLSSPNPLPWTLPL